MSADGPPLSASEVEALAAACERATPGPLDVSVWEMHNGEDTEWVVSDPHGVIAHVDRKADAELWVVVSTALPRALATIRQVRVQLAAAETAIQALCAALAEAALPLLEALWAAERDGRALSPALKAGVPQALGYVRAALGVDAPVATAAESAD